jgi:uridine kinase
MEQGTLHFISGRLASGKTSFARELAANYHAVLVSEDVWFSRYLMIFRPLTII